jgi:hypothetical protein
MKILKDHGYAIAIEGGELLDGTHRREAWKLFKCSNP